MGATEQSQILGRPMRAAPAVLRRQVGQVFLGPERMLGLEHVMFNGKTHYK